MNARVVLALVAVAGSAAVVACVLADPPPIVTPPPVTPPMVLTDSVTPPLGEKLRSNPPCLSGSDCFVVPVLADPDQAVKWRVFVDLDPTGSATQDAIIKEQDDGGVLGVTGEAGSGERTFTFSISESAGIDLTRCHTFTFIVAYDFVSNDFAKPTPPGGSRADWFYEPVPDCSVFDAGVLLDGGAD